MTKVETRRCPVYRTTCMGKLCALTGWRKSRVLNESGKSIPATEWICDFSDRVVERE